MSKTRPYPATPPTQPRISPLTRLEYARQLVRAGRLDEARAAIAADRAGIVVIEVNRTRAIDRKPGSK
jgi:hypothetical protein